jgi:pimeloyl-ACP methyl ester carboxylesterase
LATVPHYGAIRATLNIARTRPMDFLKVNAKMSLYPLVSDPMAAAHMFLDEDATEEDQHAFGVKLIDESFLGFLDMVVLNLPRKPNSDVPVCVVGGQNDKLFSPESQQSTARRLGAECHIIPDAPHDLMQSKHWTKAAQKFLNWSRSIE